MQSQSPPPQRRGLGFQMGSKSPPPTREGAPPPSSPSEYAKIPSIVQAPSVQQDSAYGKIPSLAQIGVSKPAPAVASNKLAVNTNNAPGTPCDRCQDMLADEFCGDCNKPYCKDCSSEVHHTGRWAQHNRGPIGTKMAPGLARSASSTKGFLGEQPWTCNICTLENDGTSEKCAACETPRIMDVSQYAHILIRGNSAHWSKPQPNITATSGANAPNLRPPVQQQQSTFVRPVSPPPRQQQQPAVQPAQHTMQSSAEPLSPKSAQWTRLTPSTIRQASHQAVPTVINPNISINFSGERNKLDTLKPNYKDKGTALISATCAVLLSQGVFLRDAETQETMYYRLNAEKTALESCVVQQIAIFEKKPTTPLTNPQIIKLVDITNVSLGDARAINLQLKDGKLKTLIADNEEEQSFFSDGLRLVKGLGLESKETTNTMNAIVETFALNELYSAPPPPPKPSNFNFFRNI